MLDPHREIQALVDNFVADLSELAKRIAIEQLKAAFGVGAKLAGTKLAGIKVTGTKLAGAKLAGTKLASVKQLPLPIPAPTRGRASRGRRGHREIEAIRDKLLAVIGQQPGQRAEDISAALGTKTPDIAQALRKLVAERLVRTEGARRGTRYYAAASPEAQNGRRVEPAVSAEEPAA
jgi:hypothetical protein